jgi:hypothetical protein
MVLSILLERPSVRQLDLADGPNFSDASRKSIGVESPFRELPVKSRFEQVRRASTRDERAIRNDDSILGETRYSTGHERPRRMAQGCMAADNKRRIDLARHQFENLAAGR